MSKREYENFKITDYGHVKCLDCGRVYIGYDAGFFNSEVLSECDRCHSKDRVDMEACCCCGNEYPVTELNDGLCEECYLDFANEPSEEPEDSALRHLSARVDITDVLRLRARGEEAAYA